MHRNTNKPSVRGVAPRINITKITRLFSVFMLIFLFFGGPVLATDNAVLEQQKAEAQKKLQETASQKRTLVEQVNAFDAQISGIQAEINATDAELQELASKIAKANEDILASVNDIKDKKLLLGEYIKTIYINGQTSQLELILTSTNFSDFVDQSEYLQTMRNSIDEALKEIEIAKAKLEADKVLLKEEEAKNLTLKGQQVSRQAAVQSQLSAKQSLLAATKGDEAAYKTLINSIQKEIDRNNETVWGGNLVSQGYVKKGDIIGYIGNSGYSTGSHLHFEMRDGPRTTVNPVSYMNNGYFIDPAPSVPINARYGRTSDYFWCTLEDDWCFHSGIDKADGGVGTPVRAAADGEIVARVSGYGNTYPNQYIYGNYVMIQHPNGMFTLYGHLRN